ncbi:hypothetical protein [Vibrio harveyi]|uniref:hypothetical protein n=1 Tax=Vibrio harveyi TaxID=669 RepID=UPI00165E49C1|nr:hypothetical protein [Vibrio harveyi]
MSVESDKSGNFLLSSESILNFIYHTATTDQLEKAERDIGKRLDKHSSEIDDLSEKLESKIESVNEKIDRRSMALFALLLGNLVSIVAAAFYLGTHIK